MIYWRFRTIEKSKLERSPNLKKKEDLANFIGFGSQFFLFVAEIEVQIVCYLAHLQSKIPASAAPLAKALGKVNKSELNHINRMHRKGINEDLKEQVAILAQIGALVTDRTALAALGNMTITLQIVQLKFQACTGNYHDIFNAYVMIRDALKQEVGDVCGPSPVNGLASGNHFISISNSTYGIFYF